MAGLPPVDLSRSGSDLVLTVSLPGVRPEDFRISLTGGREVHIEGTRHYRHSLPPEQLSLAERPYGPFSRKVPLPMPVNAGRAVVSFEHGVLTARLPIDAAQVRVEWDRQG